ncbi:aldehyde dehydrogenase family protein [Sphingopyxis sp. USTB-05]|uniref:aldehyde dehydrogenase family protein n=1 Tax=Sphingopyxis sp. USTB-05 TaxID=2830667 RepID=UPI002078D0CA|nr:aldehyde dehydrogenase family protein [Sphingopyxis sp. USTB-05]USI77601.1 aldehyde dehydrogenase family protein [Sphingopyxis sp. USTB-05]
MQDCSSFYIDGVWQKPQGSEKFTAINPATEMQSGTVALANKQDVDSAVSAANRAFESFSATSRNERLELLEAILVQYDRRTDNLAIAVREEMGAPKTLAEEAHVTSGRLNIATAIDILRKFDFEERVGTALICKEPIGPCALITPWNWPLSQTTLKLGAALAAGCTVVLKPSEHACFSARILAEIFHDAGTPPGVFNMIYGIGEAGAALAEHPDIAMVSFTGSTRAGVDVARRAAFSVKRVTQELGGKSPNIILDDADFETAVIEGTEAVMSNSGQTCVAPTRMLVPAHRMEQVKALIAAVADQFIVDDPAKPDTFLGPVVSRAQWERVQTLIASGIDEGASLVIGGLGRPPHLDKGWFVRPTVFADVEPDMEIARVEIFGPVLSILSYRDEEHAIALANDTNYGLAARVQGSPERSARVARRLRSGFVSVNGAPWSSALPFGGYKQSGNGREGGAMGLAEYLEVKTLAGA